MALTSSLKTKLTGAYISITNMSDALVYEVAQEGCY